MVDGKEIWEMELVGMLFEEKFSDSVERWYGLL